MRNETDLVRLKPDGSDPLVTSLENFYDGTCPVLDPEGTVYLPGGELAAIRADGTIKWRLAAQQNILTPPVVGLDGTVFVSIALAEIPSTATNRLVVAVRPDGSRKWEFQTGESSQGFLTLSGEDTVLVAAGTNLFAIRAADGRQLWQTGSPNGKPFGPSVLDFDGTLLRP